MVDALQYLKTKNLLHRDVKPSNILINRRPLCFKLCDFGICGIMNQSVALTMNKGTKIYLAVSLTANENRDIDTRLLAGTHRSETSTQWLWNSIGYVGFGSISSQ